MFRARGGVDEPGDERGQRECVPASSERLCGAIAAAALCMSSENDIRVQLGVLPPWMAAMEACWHGICNVGPPPRLWKTPGWAGEGWAAGRERIVSEYHCRPPPLRNVLAERANATQQQIWVERDSDGGVRGVAMTAQWEGGPGASDKGA